MVATAAAGVLLVVALPSPAQAAAGSFDYWNSDGKHTVSVNHPGCYQSQGGTYAVNHTNVHIVLSSSPNCSRDPVEVLWPGEGASKKFESVEVT